MQRNILNKNEENKLRIKNRRKLIYELVDEYDLQREEDIVDKLAERNIIVSQPTVHRDLKELSIGKDHENNFKPESNFKKDYHIDLLYDLLIDGNSHVASNIKTYFIKTDKGKAQEIAFHLEKTFGSVVLKTIVGIDDVIIFADGDDVDEDFHNIFK